MQSIVPLSQAFYQSLWLGKQSSRWAHLPLRLDSHSGRWVVPKLTLEPLNRQRRRLPCDHQDPAALAHCLHISGCVGFHCRGNSMEEERVWLMQHLNVEMQICSTHGSILLTMIYGGQVDGFRPDGAQAGRHFQPQLVAVHPQRLEGAGPGKDLQASGPHLTHLLTRPLPLLHHIARQVSPPAGKINK